MRAGLHVEDAEGHGAVLVAKMGWSVPPPVGARWSCCRRGDMPTAEVVGVEWAGLEGEADAWVQMNADRRLVGHLTSAHGFDPLER